MASTIPARAFRARDPVACKPSAKERVWAAATRGKLKLWRPSEPSSWGGELLS